jgi:hypothetical protein
VVWGEEACTRDVGGSVFCVVCVCVCVFCVCDLCVCVLCVFVLFLVVGWCCADGGGFGRGRKGGEGGMKGMV